MTRVAPCVSGVVRWVQRRPDGPAARFVESLWELQGGEGPRWILPKPVFDVCFPLAAPRAVPDVAATGQPKTGWVVGVGPTPRVGPAYVFGAGIRFRPGAARAFFGDPLDDFAGRVVPLAEVLGAEAERVSARLHAAPHRQARFRVLEELVVSHTASAARPEPRIQAALERLRAGGGLRPVGELAEHAGVSTRHFIALFRAEVGTTPKKLARILRLHHAIDKLRVHPSEPLGGIAFDLGFADQAHFTREIRAMTGRAPGCFRREAI